MRETVQHNFAEHFIWPVLIKRGNVLKLNKIPSVLGLVGLQFEK